MSNEITQNVAINVTPVRGNIFTFSFYSALTKGVVELIKGDYISSSSSSLSTSSFSSRSSRSSSSSTSSFSSTSSSSVSSTSSKSSISSSTEDLTTSSTLSTQSSSSSNLSTKLIKSSSSFSTQVLPSSVSSVSSSSVSSVSSSSSLSFSTSSISSSSLSSNSSTQVMSSSISSSSYMCRCDFWHYDAGEGVEKFRVTTFLNGILPPHTKDEACEELQFEFNVSASPHKLWICKRDWPHDKLAEGEIIGNPGDNIFVTLSELNSSGVSGTAYFLNTCWDTAGGGPLFCDWEAWSSSSS